MHPNENIISLAEDPMEKMKSAVFNQAINASPIALAVLGWVTGMTVTEPKIEELHATADGIIMVRHSDEVTTQMLCSLTDFLGQMRQLCGELGLTSEQTEKILVGVQKRLSFYSSGS